MASVKKAIAKKMTERDFQKRQDRLLNAHLGEMGKKRAEGFNIGWASGDNFIHSKTSKGKLHTEEHKKGYRHSWN